MRKWTVYSDRQDAISGLDTADAARVILTHDGHRAEIRRCPSGFDLYHTIRGGGGNVPMTKTVIFSNSKVEAKAKSEIFEQVVYKSEEMFGVACCLDEDYWASLSGR